MKRGNYLKYSSHRFSKFLVVISIIIVGLLSLIGSRYFSPADDKKIIILSENNETKPNSPNSIPSSTKLSTQDQSYVLINPNNSQVFKSNNADIQRAPASTTKLLTGLVAVKTLKETDLIRVGTEVNIEGSQLGLSPGDEITFQALLDALYINSSNDAATAIAVKVSGSISAFAEEMNQYAATIGCQNTHFTNPHGMPDYDHYTTANDLSIIANAFLKDEQLIQYVKKRQASVQWRDSQGMSRYAELKNTNSLLGIYPGDEGLKTGTTTEAGQCLISYVTRPDGDMLLVLLGSKQRYQDTIKLLDEGWADQRANAALQSLAKDPGALILSPGIF